MNEEKVTEAIEEHLVSSGWSIFAVDYPTTGSGLRIHPDDRPSNTKHAGSVVPDIVAYRKEQLLIVENKPYFDVGDAQKLQQISEGKYNDSLDKRIYATDFEEVVTALGFPTAFESDIRWEAVCDLDYIYLVKPDKSVRKSEVNYNQG